MQDFKERLERYSREVLGMGQTRFEDYCGLAHGTISAIKASGPSASIITRISVKCPDLNLNWLFRGEDGGEMIVGKGEDNAPAMVSVSPNAVIQNVFVTNFADLKSVMVDAIKESRK